MRETYSQDDLSEAGQARAPTQRQVRGHRGMRVALLSLAAAILLLGAAVAAAFCYQAIGRGSFW